jgi:hypothetical protein
MIEPGLLLRLEAPDSAPHLDPQACAHGKRAFAFASERVTANADRPGIYSRLAV